jgi:hypothetical protein
VVFNASISMPCMHGHQLDSLDVVAHRCYGIAVDQESSMARNVLVASDRTRLISSQIGTHIVFYDRRVYFQPRSPSHTPSAARP